MIALPVILHLVMRRQPQRLIFPALRFVQARRDANRRKIKLRHWLLLAMRCLLIAGLALALARPTLRGSGLRGKAGAPLAATMVVDTSLRMLYVRDNQTRLAEAVSIASDLVEQLPDDASIGVMGTGGGMISADLDRSTAVTRLANLRPTADSRPLAEAVVEAIRQTADKDDYRQEVFVLSDLTESAWTEEAIDAIRVALDEAPEAMLYVVDVGVADPQNNSLGDLQLDRTVLRPGQGLRVEATVQTAEAADRPVVELQIDAGDGEFRTVDQRVAVPDEAGQRRVAFEMNDLAPGIQQARLTLPSTDPLEIDNTRYFSVDVRRPARILLLAAAEKDALFLREALTPSTLNLPEQFAVEVRSFKDLATSLTESFDAVFLLDPPPLPGAAWEQVLEFAEGGGGVLVGLGHRAELRAMNSIEAGRVLAGPLKMRARDETYFRPQRLDHPALAALSDYQETIPWSECRVFTYWELQRLEADAYVIARYANGEPALVERLAGRGRLLTFTTPLSDPLAPVGREPWNVLPAQPWPFIAICAELAGYLSQDVDDPLNYLAGDTVRVPLGRRQRVSKYVLRLPDGQRQRRTAPPGETVLVLSTTDRLGNYRLTTGGEDALDRGFSVNAPGELSNLAPVDADALREAMPVDRFVIARSLNDIETYVDVGRSGRELYPWLMMAVTLVWGAEHLLANRFYQSSVGPG